VAARAAVVKRRSTVKILGTSQQREVVESDRIEQHAMAGLVNRIHFRSAGYGRAFC